MHVDIARQADDGAALTDVERVERSEGFFPRSRRVDSLPGMVVTGLVSL